MPLMNSILGMTDEELDRTQLGLGAAGMAPGVGNVADLADAGISLGRGDILGTILGLGAAIPGLGMAFGAGRGLSRAKKLGNYAGKEAKAAWTPTEAKNFRKWFGDSKVVGKSGEPLVVFHGAGTDFPEFKTPAGFPGGHYFASNPDQASRYAKLSAQYIPGEGMLARGYQKKPARIQTYPVYLKIENPRVSHVEDFQAGNIAGYKKQGYDGAINLDPDGNVQEYVAFDSDQIKSATANIGAYGQRPPTAEETARLGMSEEEAWMKLGWPGPSGKLEVPDDPLRIPRTRDIRLSLLPAAVGGGALAAQSMTEDDFARSIR